MRLTSHNRLAGDPALLRRMGLASGCRAVPPEAPASLSAAYPLRGQGRHGAGAGRGEPHPCPAGLHPQAGHDTRSRRRSRAGAEPLLLHAAPAPATWCSSSTWSGPITRCAGELHPDPAPAPEPLAGARLGRRPQRARHLLPRLPGQTREGVFIHPAPTAFLRCPHGHLAPGHRVGPSKESPMRMWQQLDFIALLDTLASLLLACLCWAAWSAWSVSTASAPPAFAPTCWWPWGGPVRQPGPEHLRPARRQLRRGPRGGLTSSPASAFSGPASSCANRATAAASTPPPPLWAWRQWGPPAAPGSPWRPCSAPSSCWRPTPPLRPLVNQINRHPVDNTDTEVTCRVTALIRRTHQKEVLPLAGADAGAGQLPLSELDIEPFGEQDLEIRRCCSPPPSTATSLTP